MSRYLLTSLIIGGAVLFVVSILYFLRAFEPLATGLANFYAARGFLVEGDATRLVWLEVLMIAAASVAVAWCVVDIAQIWQKILVAGSIAAIVFGFSPTLALYGGVFEPFSSLVAVVLSAAAAFVFAGTEAGMRKRVLENVLGARVSHATFERILNGVEPPDFGGTVHEATVLTCRVFNYEELCEKLEAPDLLRMTNLFLRNASTFLMSRGAYLDESGPELVRVFFGVLRPGEDHALHACEAALELRNRLRNLDHECEARWFRKLEWGVGISSGPLITGIFGTQKHPFFSAVGEGVDHSRRLALANRIYGSRIVVAAESYHQVADEVAVRPLDMFFDPGRHTMAEIYELTGLVADLDDEERKRLDAFWAGVIHYRERNFEKALESFSAAHVRGGDDGAGGYFLERCQKGVADPDSVFGAGRHEVTDGGHARLLETL